MIKDERTIFKYFNKCLKEENLSLKMICVGGFVLSHYGMRTTIDIDAFYKSTKKTESIIRKVGEHFSINNENELWLNHSVDSMNDCPPEKICDVLYKYSNLIVLMPPLDYIAGMKLISARVQDVEDVAMIIKKGKIKDPKDYRLKLNEYGFFGIDESVLLESFGIAYGMEWLEKYYIENEKEIIQMIKQSTSEK